MTHSEIDYSRKWFVMAAVSTGIFLATIDSSIVNVALPTMRDFFDTDIATLQWVVLAYLLTLLTLMLNVGRLADMKGKKPIYSTGFIIFTIGSVLCGLAPGVHALIGFRVVQAIGATMILALGMAIVTEAFPTHERGKALGISGSFVSIGIVVGPTVGGLITYALSWRWIFFVNLPIGLLGIWMVRRFVPDIRPSGKQRFDYLGAFTLFVSMLSLFLGLTTGQQYGFNSSISLALFVVSLVFIGLFISVELRSKEPMIDLRLFKNLLFSLNLVTGFITFVAIAGTTFLMPFFLETSLGYDTRQVGLLIAAVPLLMGFIAPLAGSLSDRFGSRPITVIGLGILVFGYSLLSRLNTQTSTIQFFLSFLPIGLGMGIFQSPNNSAIMGTAPRSRLGIVSGMLAVNRTLGQSTGIAILSAIWASRVFFHAGGIIIDGATQAPIPAQVAGLQEMFLFNILIISFAFGLSIWGLARERKLSSDGTTPANPLQSKQRT